MKQARTDGITRRDFVKWGSAVLATPVGVSCGSATGPVEGTRLTARPGVPTVVPSPGLNLLQLDGGPTGRLHIPAGHSPDTPIPLFIGLHGAGGSSDNWASYSDRAESRNMVFLAIDSEQATWDRIARGRFGPDVARLDRALEHVFTRCRIDDQRIALAGFSDGATYALSLGISNGDLLTHLVAFSPGFVSSEGDPVGTPRVYVSHGTNDGVLPVSASRDAIVPSLRNLGYDVTYNEFDGGHQVPAEISESALDWFLDSVATPGQSE